MIFRPLPDTLDADMVQLLQMLYLFFLQAGSRMSVEQQCMMSTVDRLPALAQARVGLYFVSFVSLCQPQC
jgi:hypothetical protein